MGRPLALLVLLPSVGAQYYGAGGPLGNFGGGPLDNFQWPTGTYDYEYSYEEV